MTGLSDWQWLPAAGRVKAEGDPGIQEPRLWGQSSWSRAYNKQLAHVLLDRSLGIKHNVALI